MAKSEVVYTTYIKTTPEKLWNALTTVEFMKQYWFGMHCESDWKVGSTWKLLFPDGKVADAGEIIKSEPPKTLAIKWRNEWKPELQGEGWSICTFEIEPINESVKLTVVHSAEKEASKLILAVSGGWPKVLSNLKSLLETGQAIMIERIDCRGQAA
jgi:uncharacterized protein YndB with AHSA1/START domain